MRVTEDNYIRLMKQGNERGLEYFIEHYGYIVKTIVVQKLANDSSAQEECMNDVFLSIWEHVDQYDEHRAAFTTWVSAVTKYRVLNYQRKQQKWKLISDERSIEDLQIVGENDVAVCDEEVVKEEFKQLLNGLSEEDQAIFMKIFWDEHDYEEVCQDMKISKDKLYNRVSRGKRKLRNRMEHSERRFV